jgi:hypothetical protein
LAPHPLKNDPILTIFDGWRDLNPPKVYTKYENNGTKTKVSPTSSGDTIKLLTNNNWRKHWRHLKFEYGHYSMLFPLFFLNIPDIIYSLTLKELWQLHCKRFWLHKYVINKKLKHQRYKFTFSACKCQKNNIFNPKIKNSLVFSVLFYVFYYYLYDIFSKRILLYWIIVQKDIIILYKLKWCCLEYWAGWHCVKTMTFKL